MLALALLAASWLTQGEATELQVLESVSFDDPVLPGDPKTREGGWEIGSLTQPLWVRGGVVAVPGISGSALRFDGVTGHGELRHCPASEHFTFEAWVALAAYPPAWCTLASQWRDERGWRIEIGPEGQLFFQVAVGEGRIQRDTKRPIPLRRWTHVVATCGPHPVLRWYLHDLDTSLRLYVNSREVGGGERSLLRPSLVSDEPLRIGTPAPDWYEWDSDEQQASSAVWSDPGFSLDGAIDELCIYRGAMSPDEVRRRFDSVAVPDPPLPERHVPDGPQGPGAFGAVACSLAYDRYALRDEGPACDVVVRFDTSEARFVFWGGLLHEPLWVAQDGIRAMLSPVGMVAGACEPFPFVRQTDSPISSVQIVSNHAARVVLNCRRPASLDPFAPPEEARSWINDVWTIYPDVCGARRSTFPTNTMRFWNGALRCLWEPGQDPCDLLEANFLSLAGLEGAAEPARFTDEDRSRFRTFAGSGKCTIQLLNLKSDAKPFLAFRGSCSILEPEISALDEAPQGEVHGEKDGRGFRWAFGGGVGPYVLPGGAEFTHLVGDGDLDLLFGMRPEGEDLQPLARSWARPPELTLASPEWRSLGWDRSQRAWRIERVAWSAELAFRIEASEASPLVRPALVVHGWGERAVDLTIDGALAREGVDYRQGLERQLGPTDLVVWIDRSASAPVEFRITPRE